MKGNLIARVLQVTDTLGIAKTELKNGGITKMTEDSELFGKLVKSLFEGAFRTKRLAWGLDACNPVQANAKVEINQRNIPKNEISSDFGLSGFRRKDKFAAGSIANAPTSIELLCGTCRDVA